MSEVAVLARDKAEPELDRILEILRRRISKREIPPDAKLQEHALAEEFGVSRVRIREVLLALQQRGLVERQPNRSARVIKLDIKQVIDIFDVREYLEGLGVRLAVEKNPPEAWQPMVEFYHGPMEQFARDGDFESYLDEIDVFRRRVLVAADNPVLTESLDRIYDKTRAIIDRSLMLPGRLQRGLFEMQMVVAAMRRGDAAEAERLRRENIRSQREFVERYQNFVL